MAMIQLHLSDQMKTDLEARARDCDFADVADYVRTLIQADIHRGESWEMTREIAAALAEGEASGEDSRTVQEIFAEARKRWTA
jgi:Arc/MetJ-type ribon-helix-helix transcriptional regulator